MAREDVKDLLTHNPFQPFRVRLTSGDHDETHNPLSVAPMRSRLFIALPKSDRSVVVPFLHIAALETLGNGRKATRRRRDPRS